LMATCAEAMKIVVVEEKVVKGEARLVRGSSRNVHYQHRQRRLPACSSVTLQGALLLFFSGTTAFPPSPLLQPAWLSVQNLRQSSPLCLLHRSSLPLLLRGSRSLLSAQINLYRSSPVVMCQQSMDADVETRGPEDEMVVSAINITELMDCQPFPNARGPLKVERIKESVDFLVDEVGLQPGQAMKVLSSCPQLLAIKVVRQREKLQFMRNEIGFTRAVITKVVRRFPHILKYNLDRNLRPTLSFLETSLDFDRHEVRSLLEKQPAVLQLSVEENLHPKVFFMVRELGLMRDDLKKIFLANPMLLTLSLANNLKPKIAFFKKEFDLEATEVAKIVKLHPPFLTYSQDNILNTSAYLTGFGIPRSKMRTTMLHCPQLFGLRYTRVQENVDFLRDLVALNPSQLTDVICTYPRILTYKVETNMRTKISFLTQELQLSQDELVQEIVHFPQILGYSQEKRLQKRLDHLRRCAVDIKIRARQSGGNRSKEKVKSITLKSAMTPSDSIFFSRYKDVHTLHWLAYGTIRYDPYGVHRDEDDEFSIDLTNFH